MILCPEYSDDETTLTVTPDETIKSLTFKHASAFENFYKLLQPPVQYCRLDLSHITSVDPMIKGLLEELYSRAEDADITLVIAHPNPQPA